MCSDAAAGNRSAVWESPPGVPAAAGVHRGRPGISATCPPSAQTMVSSGSEESDLRLRLWSCSGAGRPCKDLPSPLAVVERSESQGLAYGGGGGQGGGGNTFPAGFVFRGDAFRWGRDPILGGDRRGAPGRGCRRGWRPARAGSSGRGPGGHGAGRTCRPVGRIGRRPRLPGREASRDHAHRRHSSGVAILLNL
jgi:hypothetical protein